MKAKTLIKRAYQGQYNPLTPEVEAYFSVENDSEMIAAELSIGDDMKHDLIYGVSVVRYIKRTKEIIREPELSKCFHNKKVAYSHIKGLGRYLRMIPKMREALQP